MERSSSGAVAAVAFVSALISGAAFALLAKLLVGLHVEQANANGMDSVAFSNPIFQAGTMFFGMTMSLLVHIIVLNLKIPFPGYNHVIEPTSSASNCDNVVSGDKTSEPILQQQHQAATLFFLLGLPALCDIVGTNICIYGLQFIPVSVFQMLKGSVIIYVAVLKQFVLRVPLRQYMWLGITVIILAIVMVGMSSMLVEADERMQRSSTNSATATTTATAARGSSACTGSTGSCEPPLPVAGEHHAWLGVLCVLVGTMFHGMQFELEEKLMEMDEAEDLIDIAVPTTLVVSASHRDCDKTRTLINNYNNNNKNNNNDDDNNNDNNSITSITGSSIINTAANNINIIDKGAKQQHCGEAHAVVAAASTSTSTTSDSGSGTCTTMNISESSPLLQQQQQPQRHILRPISSASTYQNETATATELVNNEHTHVHYGGTGRTFSSNSTNEMAPLRRIPSSSPISPHMMRIRSRHRSVGSRSTPCEYSRHYPGHSSAATCTVFSFTSSRTGGRLSEQQQQQQQQQKQQQQQEGTEMESEAAGSYWLDPTGLYSPCSPPTAASVASPEVEEEEEEEEEEGGGGGGGGGVYRTTVPVSPTLLFRDDAVDAVDGNEEEAAQSVDTDIDDDRDTKDTNAAAAMGQVSQQVSPLLLTGMEGLWGFIGCVMIIYFVPTATLVRLFGPSVEMTVAERMQILLNDANIRNIWLCFAMMSLVFNILASVVTFILDSVWHAILDNFRPVVIWSINLVIFYFHISIGGTGEAWNVHWSWLQLLGLCVLLLGTAVYNAPHPGSILLTGGWRSLYFDFSAEYADVLIKNIAGGSALDDEDDEEEKDEEEEEEEYVEEEDEQEEDGSLVTTRGRLVDKVEEDYAITVGDIEEGREPRALRTEGAKPMHISSSSSSSSSSSVFRLRYPSQEGDAVRSSSSISNSYDNVSNQLPPPVRQHQQQQQQQQQQRRRRPHKLLSPEEKEATARRLRIYAPDLTTLNLDELKQLLSNMSEVPSYPQMMTPFVKKQRRRDKINKIAALQRHVAESQFVPSLPFPEALHAPGGVQGNSIHNRNHSPNDNNRDEEERRRQQQQHQQQQNRQGIQIATSQVPSPSSSTASAMPTQQPSMNSMQAVVSPVPISSTPTPILDSPHPHSSSSSSSSSSLLFFSPFSSSSSSSAASAAATTTAGITNAAADGGGGDMNIGNSNHLASSLGSYAVDSPRTIPVNIVKHPIRSPSLFSFHRGGGGGRGGGEERTVGIDGDNVSADAALLSSSVPARSSFERTTAGVDALSVAAMRELPIQASHLRGSPLAAAATTKTSTADTTGGGGGGGGGPLRRRSHSSGGGGIRRSSSHDLNTTTKTRKNHANVNTGVCSATLSDIDFRSTMARYEHQSNEDFISIMTNSNHHSSHHSSTMRVNRSLQHPRHSPPPPTQSPIRLRQKQQEQQREQERDIGDRSDSGDMLLSPLPSASSSGLFLLSPLQASSSSIPVNIGANNRDTSVSANDEVATMTTGGIHHSDTGVYEYHDAYQYQPHLSPPHSPTERNMNIDNDNNYILAMNNLHSNNDSIRSNTTTCTRTNLHAGTTGSGSGGSGESNAVDDRRHLPPLTSAADGHEFELSLPTDAKKMNKTQ